MSGLTCTLLSGLKLRLQMTCLHEMSMSTHETYLNVKGMKCDGCIARAREALSKVAGVVHADFDLKAGTAVVTGDADSRAVAQALSDTGYPAELRSR